MSNADLRDAINNIVQSQYDNKSIIFFCRVTAIDTVNQTFTAQNIKGESDDILENCQINVGSGNNIVSMPAVGSQVLLIRDNSDNQYYMIKQDEVSSATVSVTGEVKIESTVSVDANTPNFYIDCENFYVRNNSYPGSPNSDIVFNGGLNGGVTNTVYLGDRLLEIEQVLNYWRQMFDGWTPIPGDGGTALWTIFKSIKTLNPDAFKPGITSRTDLEDDKFLH